MTSTDDAIEMVRQELHRAREKFPKWPMDVVHGAAIVAEEAGELVRASLQATYEPKDGGMSWSDVRTEAIQTACTAIRLLCALEWSTACRPHQIRDVPEWSAEGKLQRSGNEAAEYFKQLEDEFKDRMHETDPTKEAPHA